MTPESLIASALINIGLAIVIICLFSVLRKQHANANIYYSRRIGLGISVAYEGSYRRFLPSFEWIRDAVKVTEDDILSNCGLDALVVVRYFKLGIKFFVVCSAVGLMVLLPVNCSVYTGPSSRYRSMDFLTISNIPRGSNRLWGHFVSLCFISFTGIYLLHKEYKTVLMRRVQQLRNLRNQPSQFTVLVRRIPLCNEHKAFSCNVDHFFSKYHPHAYHSYQIIYRQKHLQELPVAFVTFRSRWDAALASQTQQHPNPLLWITQMAPEPRDVLWKNLSIPYKHLVLYRAGVYVTEVIITIFFAIPVTAVQGIAQFEKLKKWFPPAMAVQLIPGLSSVITGYLPSVILSGFVYVVPFVMKRMARVAGYVSRSQQEQKASNMVYYFLMGNVFFLSVLSGSLFDQIGKTFINPGDVPSRLAMAVSAQADFFMTYILTSGMSGFSLEILQPGLLMWDIMKVHTWGRGKQKSNYLYSFPYHRVIPFVSLFVLVGVVYAVIAPLLLPFLVVYFLLGYVVYINQFLDVYKTTYETCGQYWPHIHHQVVLALIIMQITMVGLFGLKSKPSASIATIPLLFLTVAYNEYCKFRFLPTFYKCSVQDAKDNDELDKDGPSDDVCRKAIEAYRPPSLPHPYHSMEESTSTQPLLLATP
ncbi:calcium-dependent channel, 7TM region, putative phosphate [Artemisia annua]|uniref:Calcium-dependent channel, 7TM region, putative phosphate n=1 Tax=Artemisia annua TaxID=35608 RepID=A0A2U1PFA5_ARTAN|nr:calcium-dependent channel, 7TM region, putative phosphate [Artemisia annua]